MRDRLEGLLAELFSCTLAVSSDSDSELIPCAPRGSVTPESSAGFPVTALW